MSDLEYLVRLINECRAKERRRFASAAAEAEFDNLFSKIEQIVINNSDNKEVIMTAADYSPFFLQNASAELKKDPEIIMFALKSPKAAKYINSYGFDKNVLEVVQGELSNQSQEAKNEFYALDGSKFATMEEALAHNDGLLNTRAR